MLQAKIGTARLLTVSVHCLRENKDDEQESSSHFPFAAVCHDETAGANNMIDKKKADPADASFNKEASLLHCRRMIRSSGVFL